MSTVMVAPSSPCLTFTGEEKADHTTSEPGGCQVTRSSKRRMGSQPKRVPKRRPLRYAVRELIGILLSWTTDNCILGLRKGQSARRRCDQESNSRVDRWIRRRSCRPGLRVHAERSRGPNSQGHLTPRGGGGGSAWRRRGGRPPARSP